MKPKSSKKGEPWFQTLRIEHTGFKTRIFIYLP